MGARARRILVLVAAAVLVGIAFEVEARIRTAAPDLKTSQGVASVLENLRSLARVVLEHEHRGNDGSSRLTDPYISGDVILQSDNGSCWSCGPDNAGTWACAAATCPS